MQWSSSANRYFRIAANWHIDLQLATIPYFLLFQKPLKSRYFRPRIPLRANRRLSWAIKWRFWDTISLFLRWIFLWTYVLRFMEVRPKGACTYVLRVHARTSIEFVVRNVASIWLKTAKMSGKLPKNLFFPFPDCIFKRNIFKYQYVRYNNVLVTFWKSPNLFHRNVGKSPNLCCKTLLNTQLCNVTSRYARIWWNTSPCVYIVYLSFNKRRDLYQVVV